MRPRESRSWPQFAVALGSPSARPKTSASNSAAGAGRGGEAHHSALGAEVHAAGLVLTDREHGLARHRRAGDRRQPRPGAGGVDVAPCDTRARSRPDLAAPARQPDLRERHRVVVGQARSAAPRGDHAALRDLRHSPATHPDPEGAAALALGLEERGDVVRREPVLPGQDRPAPALEPREPAALGAHPQDTCAVGGGASEQPRAVVGVEGRAGVDPYPPLADPADQTQADDRRPDLARAAALAQLRERQDLRAREALRRALDREPAAPENRQPVAGADPVGRLAVAALRLQEAEHLVAGQARGMVERHPRRRLEA